LGAGVIMPLYTIAVQNAVPYAVMGVATSSTAFIRSLAGALGLAIFGSALNNRFAAEFTARLSAEAKALIPPEMLDRLVHNPQALVSPQAQDQLRAFFEQAGTQGASVFNEVLDSLRLALSSALGEVFFIGFIVLVVAWLANLFIKEIPLRRHHG
jgi:hypothetical protein